MSKRSDEDMLFRNVQDLRRRLQYTERSLQSISALEASQTIDNDSHNSRSSSPDPDDSMTIEELTPEMANSLSRSTQVTGQKDSHFGSSYLTFKQPLNVAHSTPQSSKLKASQVEFGNQKYIQNENETMRKKLQLLREENTNIVAQNNKLMIELESLSHGLHQTHTKVQQLTEELDQFRIEVPRLHEKIILLESENEANNNALRDAEDRYEESQRKSAELEECVEQLRRELEESQKNLLEEQENLQSVESERDDALESLQEVQETLNQYQRKANEKLRKHMDSEEHLKDSLSTAEQNIKQLSDSIQSRDARIQTLQDSVRNLENSQLSENEKSGDLETQNVNLRAEIAQMMEKMATLQHQVQNLNQVEGENEALRRKVQQLHEHLSQCQEDIEISKNQLLEVERLAQHMKEIHAAQADSAHQDSGVSSDNYHSQADRQDRSVQSDTLTEEPVNTDQNAQSHTEEVAELRHKLSVKEAEIQQLHVTHQAQLLENGQQAEEEKQQLSLMVSRLGEDVSNYTSQLLQNEAKLSAALAQLDALRVAVHEKNTHLTDLQKELNEQVNRATVLERETHKKAAQVSSLEQQLDEKAATIAQHVLTISQLEQNLSDKTAELTRVRGEVDEKQQEAEHVAESFSKVKKLHSAQCDELQQQLEMLQERLEEHKRYASELEMQVTDLSGKLQLTETSLQNARKEFSEKLAENEATTVALEQQAAESTRQVKQLESALLVCQKELETYLSQLDYTKQNYDTEISHKTQQLKSLEKQLSVLRKDLHAREELICELEKTLQERQAMLTISTSRISELEENQMHMQSKMSKLEQDKERELSGKKQELSSMEKKLHQACAELEQRTGQITQLVNTLKDVEASRKRLADDVQDLGQQLDEEDKDCENKMAALATVESQLREALRQQQALQRKVEDTESLTSQLKKDLNDEQLNSKNLKEQLHHTQNESQENLVKASELEKLLQHSKAQNQSQNEQLTHLRETLKACQEELRHSEKEKEATEQELRDRQWELHQRAAQVNKLDVTIKEHTSELQQTINKLERELKQSQSHSEHATKQLNNLDKELEQKTKELNKQNLAIQQLQQTNTQCENQIQIKHNALSQKQEELDLYKSEIQEIKKEKSEINQELRVAREKQQKGELELIAAHKQIELYKKDNVKMTQRQEDLEAVLQDKDKDTARLAEELGQYKTKEAEAETMATEQIHQMRNEIKKQAQLHENELSKVKQSHEQDIKCMHDLSTEQGHQVEELLHRQQELHSALLEAGSVNTRLKNELLATQQVLDVANKTVVIKEAEIARLEAKISGYERATFGSSSPHNSSRVVHQNAQPSDSQNSSLVQFSSPASLKQRPIMKRSNSDMDVYASLSNTSVSSSHPEGNAELYFTNGNDDMTSDVARRTGHNGREEITSDVVRFRGHHHHGANTLKPKTLHFSSDVSGVDTDSEPDTLQGMLREVSRLNMNNNRTEVPQNSRIPVVTQKSSHNTDNSHSFMSSAQPVAQRQHPRAATQQQPQTGNYLNSATTQVSLNSTDFKQPDRPQQFVTENQYHSMSQMQQSFTHLSNRNGGVMGHSVVSHHSQMAPPSHFPAGAIRYGKPIDVNNGSFRFQQSGMNTRLPANNTSSSVKTKLFSDADISISSGGSHYVGDEIYHSTPVQSRPSNIPIMKTARDLGDSLPNPHTAASHSEEVNPEQCIQELQKRLQENELRRQKIDQQLQDVQFR